MVRKASLAEASMSSVSATLKATEKKVALVEETSSKDLKDAERRMSARVQSIATVQSEAHQEVRCFNEPRKIYTRSVL